MDQGRLVMGVVEPPSWHGAMAARGVRPYNLGRIGGEVGVRFCNPTQNRSTRSAEAPTAPFPEGPCE